MMKNLITAVVFLALFLLSGCGGLFPEQLMVPSLDAAAISTYAYETVVATLTQGAGQKVMPVAATATPEPTVEQPSATPLPSSTSTPEPSLTPTASLTATPSATATGRRLRVSENTNCRLGPHPMYRVIGYVTKDLVVDVVGTNSSHDWWLVRNPTDPRSSCWVWNVTSTVEGETASLPVFAAPWTPTPGVPEVDVAVTRLISDQTVTCPFKLQFAGVIRTDSYRTFQYRWVMDADTTADRGEVVIAADSLAYLGGAVTIHDTTSGTILLEVTSPVSVRSEAVPFTVTCK